MRTDDACRLHLRTRGRCAQEIVAQVERLGAGSLEREETTYATVVREYLGLHGVQAKAAQGRRLWVEALPTFGAALAGLVVIIAVVERLRPAHISKELRHPISPKRRPRRK